jgi:putative spermidine/putrescine transport system permease protein
VSPRRWNWLVLPMLLAFGVTFVPALAAFSLLSFHPSAGLGAVRPEWTLDNYGRILTDSLYLGALGRTLLLGALTVLGTLILGFPLAYLISRTPTPFSLGLFTLLYVSSLTSIVIRGLGWITLLGNNGPLNRLLVGSGLVDAPVPFMGNVFGASIAMVHYMLPFMVLTLIPVVQTINPALEEAAAGLGASFVTTVRLVVIPLAAPGIVAGSLLVFAMTIGAFVIPRMIGGTTMHVMSLLIDQQMLTTFNYAIGATLAFILLVLVMGVVATAGLVLQRGSYAR